MIYFFGPPCVYFAHINSWNMNGIPGASVHSILFIITSRFPTTSGFWEGRWRHGFYDNYFRSNLCRFVAWLRIENSLSVQRCYQQRHWYVYTLYWIIQDGAQKWNMHAVYTIVCWTEPALMGSFRSGFPPFWQINIVVAVELWFYTWKS